MYSWTAVLCTGWHLFTRYEALGFWQTLYSDWFISHAWFIRYKMKHWVLQLMRFRDEILCVCAVSILQLKNAIIIRVTVNTHFTKYAILIKNMVWIDNSTKCSIMNVQVVLFPFRDTGAHDYEKEFITWNKRGCTMCTAVHSKFELFIKIAIAGITKLLIKQVCVFF